MSGDTLLTCDGRALTLGTVLQALDLDAVTGTLDVAGGSIGLRDGAVVSAALGSWAGLDAFFELSVQPPAPIVVRAAEPRGGAPLGPTPGLVLEAARRTDDFRRLGGLVLAWARAATADTTARDRDVLAAVDGRRAAWEIADALGRPRTHVVHVLAPLVASGLLAATGAPRPVPERAEVRRSAEPVADGDLWAALDHGRSLLRRGQLAEARVAFQSALALRPDDRVAAQNLRRLDRLIAGELR